MNVKVVHVSIMELAWMASTHIHASACQAGLGYYVKQVDRYEFIILIGKKVEVSLRLFDIFERNMVFIFL